MRVLSLFSGVGGLCSLGLGAAGHDGRRLPMEAA